MGKSRVILEEIMEAIAVNRDEQCYIFAGNESREGEKNFGLR